MTLLRKNDETQVVVDCGTTIDDRARPNLLEQAPNCIGLAKTVCGKILQDWPWLAIYFYFISGVFSGKCSLKKYYFDSVPLLGNNTKLVKISTFLCLHCREDNHVWVSRVWPPRIQTNIPTMNSTNNSIPEQSGDAESWPTATRSSRRGRIPFVFLGLDFSTLSSPSRSLGWRGLRKSCWRKPREPPSTTEIRHSGRFMNFAHGSDR